MNLKQIKKQLKVGARITCFIRTEAYYSRYSGMPECWFEAGKLEIVGAVDVTYVRGEEGRTFVCVDFYKKNVPPIHPSRLKHLSQCADWQINNYCYIEPWRCSLDWDNIKILN